MLVKICLRLLLVWVLFNKFIKTEDIIRHVRVAARYVSHVWPIKMSMVHNETARELYVLILATSIVKSSTNIDKNIFKKVFIPKLLSYDVIFDNWMDKLIIDWSLIQPEMKKLSQDRKFQSKNVTNFPNQLSPLLNRINPKCEIKCEYKLLMKEFNNMCMNRLKFKDKVMENAASVLMEIKMKTILLVTVWPEFE